MRNWIVAVAAVATIGAGTVDVQAQGNSQRARSQQEERTTARQQEQRERERDRIREQRQAEARRTVDIRADDRRRAEERRRIEERRRDRDDDRRRDDDDRYDDRYNDRQDPRSGGWEVWDRASRTSKGRKSGGPAFCRSGEGHPVFGRQWCRDKGWELGNGRNDRDVWGDVILRQPRDRDRRDQSLGRTVLQDILGSVVLGRVEGHGRRYADGATTGRWLNDGNGGLVLQLNMGSTPIARLVDANRDGRLDRVLLRQ